MRCPLTDVCGLKNKYCVPDEPEIFPKSNTRDQFPFATNVAQNSIVTADEPLTSPPGKLTKLPEMPERLSAPLVIKAFPINVPCAMPMESHATFEFVLKL